MRYRLVKSKDIKDIVNLHYSVRENYPFGIFSSLDKNFLKSYYKVLLKDKNSVIVCAYDSLGVVHGFCSANLNVEEQFLNLKRNKYRFGLSAFTSILKKPSVLLDLFSRYNSIKNEGSQFISKEGARLEYWVWSKKNKEPTPSIIMHEVLLNILRDLRVVELNFEVDSINNKIVKFHKLNGAIEIKRIVLEDKRERVLMKYDFSNRKSKIKLYKL